MEVEQPPSQPSLDHETKAKENSSAAGNHSDAHLNGMSNGFDKKREHKSEHRDREKDRSHKSEHKEKDRSKDKEKSHKSEHRDKDKHKHSSSSSKDKDRHDSSSKDKKSSSSSTKEKDHKSSSSSSSKDKDKGKDKEHHHKSSSNSSSKDKERHHSSTSKDKESSKSKDREKDRHKHSSSSSSRDKDKDKNVSSKDKEKDKKHSSEKDKDKHSTSHTNDKDKHRSEKERHSSSSKDKHRHEKDKDRHRHDKEKSKQKEDKDKKEKIKEEVKVKEEAEVKTEHLSNKYNSIHNLKREMKEEPISQMDMDDEDDSGGEQRLCITGYEDEDEMKEEEASMDSTDGNDTRLSEMHNTTLKTEEDSDEDTPLNNRSLSFTTAKRKIDSDEDDDVPLSARKKAKKETVKAKKKKRKHDDSEDEYDESKEQKPKKKVSKAAKGENPSPRKKKQEEEQQEVWKWWEEEKKSDGVKWTFLEHKGPVFAPAYEPLPPTVKFYYNGKELKLSQDTEEVATFYARMLDHDYTTKEAFNNNFFHDWREVMTDSERTKITDLNKCNFKEMHAYFLQKSEERKNMTKEEKKKIKEQNDEIQKQYGFCTIDGHKEKIGNFKIEPPGLFRGRGEHPKMGKLKKRVMPEDVMINCSKNSNIPKPPSGHKWKEVRHDPGVTWLASWTENIQGQAKYVMLNPSSKLKGEKDWQKYETARKLAKSIDKIRAEYRADWKSKEMRIRQRAVALYFIDKLALRAGNEKDEDQADTVGCCSLRVEHISLHEQKDGKEYVVVFDFLGKDSIRYYNEVPVEKRVFKSLQLFMENKSPSDDLFDRLNTAVMNKHLNELMEGLTAKVFRTYNASWTLQQQLDKLTNPDDTVAEKILSYNRANRAVAILCNHQRSVPKTHAKSMENLKAKIDAKREAISEAELQVKDAKRDAKHGSVKEKVQYEKKKKQLERLKEQLTKLEVQATDREENKEIALGTSKLNYLDPRISVAWCKKYDVPIEKIYNKTQRDKFRWAIDMAGPDYVF